MRSSLDQTRAFFSPRTSETKEGRRIIATYWDIDRFLEWLPDAFDSAQPLIDVLWTLLEGTREHAESQSYREYLHEPLPDDNTGRFSSNRAVRESLEQSFTHRKNASTPITIKPIAVTLQSRK